MFPRRFKGGLFRENSLDRVLYYQRKQVSLCRNNAFLSLSLSLFLFLSFSRNGRSSSDLPDRKERQPACSLKPSREGKNAGGYSQLVEYAITRDSK